MDNKIKELAFKTLLVERRSNGLVIVTLNRPEVGNAVNTEMGLELLDLWTDFVRNNENLRCVILTGAGEEAFCAGGDIRDLYHTMKVSPGTFQPYVTEFFTKEYTLDYLIHTFDKPVLVWGNGACRADGASARQHLLEIASHAYLVIAPGKVRSGPTATLPSSSSSRERRRTARMRASNSRAENGLTT